MALCIDAEMHERKVSDSFIADDSSSPTKAHNTMAYAILLLLGIGNMLPWNAFITAKSFYEARLCGSAFRSSFENYFVLCFEFAQPLGLFVSLFHGHWISAQDQVRYPLIIYSSIFFIITITAGVDIAAIPMFWMTVIFTFCCGFSSALMNGGLYGLSGILPPVYTSAIMLGSSVSGLVVSYSSLITEAASLSLPDCSTDGADDDDASGNCSDGFSIDYGSISYFVITTFVIFLCIISFEIFIRTSFLRYYMAKLLQTFDYDDPDLALVSLSLSYKNSPNKNINDRASLLALSYHSRSNIVTAIKALHPREGGSHSYNSGIQSSGTSDHISWKTTTDTDTSNVFNPMTPQMSAAKAAVNSQLVQPLLIPSNPIHHDPRHISDDLQSIVLGSVAPEKAGAQSKMTLSTHLRTTDPLTDGTFASSKPPQSPMQVDQLTIQDIFHVLYIIRIPAFSVFINFVISISIFPSLIVSIQPQSDCPSAHSARVFNELWIPIIFVLWNTFDFLGRYLAEYTKHVNLINAKNLWIVADARAFILFLILFCNIKDSRFPKAFVNDSIPLILISLFGLTGGFVANLSMMLGPELVPLDKSSLAGTIMVVALTLGLVGGSMLSFLVVYLIRGDVFG
jgi:hypothetical protein